MTKHVSKACKVYPGDRVTLPVKVACKPKLTDSLRERVNLLQKVRIQSDLIWCFRSQSAIKLSLTWHGFGFYTVNQQVKHKIRSSFLGQKSRFRKVNGERPYL